MTSHATRPAVLVAALIDELVTSVASSAARLFNTMVLEMRYRRASRDLRMLDDHMLADIELQRSNIEHAVRLERITATLPAAAGY